MWYPLSKLWVTVEVRSFDGTVYMTLLNYKTLELRIYLLYHFHSALFFLLWLISPLYCSLFYHLFRLSGEKTYYIFKFSSIKLPNGPKYDVIWRSLKEPKFTEFLVTKINTFVKVGGGKRKPFYRNFIIV